MDANITVLPNRNTPQQQQQYHDTSERDVPIDERLRQAADYQVEEIRSDNSSNFGTFGRTTTPGANGAPDGDHDRIPLLLPKYHVCIPGCCTEHWKQCRIGYIIGATMVGLLAGTMLSLSIFYGITAQQAAARSTKEIYMSANETYNITDGHQSYMLQKVCIRTERNNIDWTIMKGRCSVKDETRIEDTIKLEGSIDEKKGYLFYLLRGSVFHIEGNIYVCQSLQS